MTELTAVFGQLQNNNLLWHVLGSQTIPGRIFKIHLLTSVISRIRVTINTSVENRIGG
jgi:hypothetical protein